MLVVERQKVLAKEQTVEKMEEDYNNNISVYAMHQRNSKLESKLEMVSIQISNLEAEIKRIHKLYKSKLKGFMKTSTFTDGACDNRKPLSPYDSESELLAYIEDQFGLKVESEDEKREAELEKEMLKKIGVRKDYESRSMKKQFQQLLTKFR